MAEGSKAPVLKLFGVGILSILKNYWGPQRAFANMGCIRIDIYCIRKYNGDNLRIVFIHYCIFLTISYTIICDLCIYYHKPLMF